MNLILRAIFGLTIVQGKYFWPIATIVRGLSNCYTTKQAHLLPIFSPHPSLIHFSPTSRLFLTHLSSIPHPSLTYFSLMSHRFLIHLSLISHPSRTHFTSISHPFLTKFTLVSRGLGLNLISVLFDLILYLHFFSKLWKDHKCGSHT